ncbi:MAG: sugar phosphate isomerase/epimerase [Thermoguttaceae bacterium]|nr:sugar phosphate isomerase/epimerase [Thermoguttaceae bacterium]
MFWGFNTNGLAHHSLSDVVSLLSGIGYEGIAITLDHDLLERRDGDFFWRLDPWRIASLLQAHSLKSVIETGARYLLNPWKKHFPNLLDPLPENRRLRRNYYFRAVELARILRSDCVSIWSGGALMDEEGHLLEEENSLWKRLGEELAILLDFASERGVRIAFEPEPGMFVNTMEKFERLLDFTPPGLYLTLDVGHLFCQNETIPYWIERQKERLINIHFEDAVRGIHEHLFPGEGGIDYGEFLTALDSISYSGGIFLELSRSSAAGTETAIRAFEFLKENCFRR